MAIKDDLLTILLANHTQINKQITKRKFETALITWNAKSNGLNIVTFTPQWSGINLVSVISYF